MTSIQITAGLAALALSFGSTAADTGVSSEQQTQGSVKFVSGGVGDDETVAMQSAARGYPLELQFVQKASPRDEFLADVKVRILDRSRNVVLEAVASGPFLLAQLPPGRYQIEADYSGVVKRRSVDLSSGKHQRAVFVWAPADDNRQSMVESTDNSPALR